jgi:hypothetical protein
MARGADCHSLVKQAVMLQAADGQGNIKEWSFAPAADGGWRLFYEFASEGASGVGIATAPGFGERWTGATADARWRVGWISFDPDFTQVTGRRVEPMLVPPQRTEPPILCSPPPP